MTDSAIQLLTSNWPLRSVVLTAALLIGCSSTSTPPPTADVSSEPESSDVAVIAFDSGRDLDQPSRDAWRDPEDVEDEEEVTRLLERGELCEEDLECASELCITVDDNAQAGVCSNRCTTDLDCLSGFSCERLSSQGTDIERVCIAEDLCVDADDDGHGIGPGCLGDDCDDDNPARYVNAPEVCNGNDDDCDGVVDDGIPEVGDRCETGFPGVCSAGSYLCDDALLTCIPDAEPSAERCNAVDDDCDASTDEGDGGEPLARECYSADPETLGVGQCVAGRETCVGGEYSNCVGSVGPIAETCNGLDDDCDGLEDEGNPESGGACTTDLPGACAPGTYQCVEGERVCVPNLEAAVETCNGTDDDCDGGVDEQADGSPLARSCYTGPEGTEGIGSCEAGTDLCIDGGWAGCTGQTLPSAEVCDTLNNDCDADGADEGNPGGGLLCTTTIPGECAAGITQCTFGGVLCIPTRGPEEEVCDGADNDCDGESDEDEAGAALEETCYSGAPGTAGVGECTEGRRTCSGGEFTACVGERAPTGELCNLLDDDCDSSTDEGCPTAFSLITSETSEAFGGGGGTPFSEQCEAGSALVGIEGHSSATLHRLLGVCSPLSMIEDRSSTPFEYPIEIGAQTRLPSHGSEGGGAFRFICPVGHVVSGIRGRGAATLVGLSVDCRELEASDDGSGFAVRGGPVTTSPLYGGAGTSSFAYQCMDDGFARSLFGEVDADITSVGVRCGQGELTLR